MYADLRWVMDAFWRLSPSRSVGMALGSIPFESVDRYAARFGIEGERFEEFYGYIRALDNEFLKHANRKADG